ncbi:DUF7683 domain-containing protein [Alteromonas ponticola]|uniref:DUF7683 domain-containing protein n=1 Tax=Alteromonas ponticola TaxID=2720613 RepID=A0ABX1R5Q6_9ALTE|nr:hypothetical protein [Alteromonas ponticola]NMH60976.1 hypothetical protein [Alteromonas ponticola]
MTRIIRYFDKQDESLVGEFKVGELQLAELQLLFEVDSSNPMYDSFQIKSEMIPYFSAFTNHPFNFSQYDYFLEFDT